MKHKPSWVMRNGEAMFIDQMDVGHLVNSIQMLQRKHAAFLEMSEFPQRDNEFQQEVAETAFFSLMCSTPAVFWPVYDDLVDELKKRMFIVC